MTFLSIPPLPIRLLTVSMERILKSPHLLEQARLLSRGSPHSGMNMALDEFAIKMSERPDQPPKGAGIFAISGSRYLGWCLLIGESVAYDNPKPDEMYAHIYVDMEYRRRGIGTLLMEEAIQLTHQAGKRVNVYRYNNPGFFANFPSLA